MAMEPILAMTAAEMRNISDIPPRIAWMACHFSPYGLGLSNLPKGLPSGSLLILDDCTPPCRHDPELVAEQLAQCAETLECCGILLDFQRAGQEETQALAKHLASALPCPVAVSECYGKELDCPVFLSPVLPSMSPEEYMRPWKDREVWLEWSTEGEILTLTEQGCTVTPLPYPDLTITGLAEETLHCHYAMETNEKAARFTLWRTKEDTEALLLEAEKLGIGTVIGLYQEWNQCENRPALQQGGLEHKSRGIY